jgi:hypothetical protein
MRRTVALAVLVLVAAGACDTGSDEEPAGGLAGALNRIAANDTTRQEVNYDDTAAIRALIGDGPVREGFGQLALRGAPNLVNLGNTAETELRLVPLQASYTISAGRPPNTVGVVAGGQKGDEVSGALTKLGWTRDGDRLVAPGLSTAEPNVSRYALALGQVRADGADVVYGSAGAQLSHAGRPSGDTLGGDRRIKALAGCLGDVVAAQIVANRDGEATAIAVGVLRPAAKTDTPKTVVCVAWGAQQAADGYATRVKDALANGRSQASRQPYAELVRAPEVTTVGGDEHLVRWRGETPGRAALGFQMLATRDLPGLSS